MDLVTGSTFQSRKNPHTKLRYNDYLIPRQQNCGMDNGSISNIQKCNEDYKKTINQIIVRPIYNVYSQKIRFFSQ